MSATITPAAGTVLNFRPRMAPDSISTPFAEAARIFRRAGYRAADITPRTAVTAKLAAAMRNLEAGRS